MTKHLKMKYTHHNNLTSKIRTISLVLILISSFDLFGQHKNIVIDGQVSNYPNEPSLVIDPNNPQRMMAASNINNYYFSEDAGENWVSGKLSSVYGVWGDPALMVDNYGDFYFFHLSNPPGGNWIDRIVCQKTADLGNNWTPGSFMGLNGAKAQDKEWPVVNRKNNHIYISWTQFDNYGSSSASDSSHIMFSRSFDAGDNWEPAIRLDKKGGDCIDDDNTVEGAVPALGPNGEIYIAWAGPEGIVLDKSSDEGSSWLKNEIHVSDNPGGWNYEIPCIFRCNGLPVTVCDTSQSINRGNIYVNWTDQRNGLNDTDVWLARSVDGGESWEEAVRVNNDPPGKHQFLSWATIDQTNGTIYVVFYDRRNYTDNRTDVYLAKSEDGGLNFTNHLISEAPFVPNDGIFFGDYTNINAHNDIIRPIWARLHAGELSVLTAIVNPEFLTSENEKIAYSHSIELEQNYPNPFTNETYISFKLHKAEILDLNIYDVNGQRGINIFEQKDFTEGKHVLRISDQLINLEAGVYYYVLKSGDGFFYKKMIQVND